MNGSGGNKVSNFLQLDSCPQMTSQHYLFSLVQLQTLSQSLHVAANYGIANFILSTGKPLHISELAKSLKFHEDNLKRFMSYLASHGIFEELEGGYFAGTQLSDLLRDDVPGSMRDFIRWQGSKYLTLAMLEMGHSLETGEPSFELANGTPLYSFLDKNPPVQRSFDAAMEHFHEPLQKAVTSMYNFGCFDSIVELGGGSGRFIKEILTNHPGVKMATLYEREAALPNVLPELKKDPYLRDRFQFVAGDFLTGINCTADLFVIAETLHNFKDEDVVKIGCNIARAMARRKDSRLLIIEPKNEEFIPNRPATVSRSLDLLMMFVLDGKERSPIMWRQLLAKCGIEFTDMPLIKVPPIFVVYECRLMQSTSNG